LAALLLAGCSSHERRFESLVPPRTKSPPGAEEEDAVALQLIRRYRPVARRLPAETLASLTQASAILYYATPTTELHDSVGRFADALLGSRLRPGYEWREDAGPPRSDPGVTALAGTALIDAYLATRRQRYRSGVLSFVKAVRSRRLGWTRTRQGFAVRTPGTPRTLNIALTGQVIQFLDHFGRALDRPRSGHPTAGSQPGQDRLPPGRLAARRGIDWIRSAQPAVGRWYAAVLTRRPRIGREWATTLLALAVIGGGRASGILGPGVPAIWRAMFRANGHPRRGTTSSREGLALALSVFEEWSDRRYARRAFASALRTRRRDGSTSFAPARDSVTQAYFALSLARRVFHAAERAASRRR